MQSGARPGTQTPRLLQTHWVLLEKHGGGWSEQSQARHHPSVRELAEGLPVRAADRFVVTTLGDCSTSRPWTGTHSLAQETQACDLSGLALEDKAHKHGVRERRATYPKSVSVAARPGRTGRAVRRATLNIVWLGVELLSSGGDIRAGLGKLGRELMVTSVLYALIELGPGLARQIVDFMRVSADGIGGGAMDDQTWNALQAIVKASVGLLSNGEVSRRTVAHRLLARRGGVTKRGRPTCTKDK